MRAAAVALVAAGLLAACGGGGTLGAAAFGRAASKACDDGARAVARVVAGRPSPDVRLARAQQAHARALATIGRLRPAEGNAEEATALIAALRRQEQWFARAVRAVRRSPDPNPGGVVGRVALEGDLMKGPAASAAAAGCARMADAATQAATRDEYALAIRRIARRVRRRAAEFRQPLRAADPAVIVLEVERRDDFWYGLAERVDRLEPSRALEDEHDRFLTVLRTLSYSMGDAGTAYESDQPRRGARELRKYNRALERVDGARRRVLDALGEDPPGLVEPQPPSDSDIGTPS